MPYPISRALQLPADRFGRRLRATIRAIESVHWVDGLPTVPVEVRKLRDAEGEYQKHSGTGQPVRIVINRKGERPGLTLAHELGHLLEGVAIPGANYGRRRWEADPTIVRFLEAARASRAAAGIRPVEAGGDPIERGYASYLIRPAELWARSYAQHIAVRSADLTLQEQLRNRRAPAGLISVQWDEVDFEPIAAIDELFRTLGWLR
jgi:hypothetical protein